MSSSLLTSVLVAAALAGQAASGPELELPDDVTDPATGAPVNADDGASDADDDAADDAKDPAGGGPAITLPGGIGLGLEVSENDLMKGLVAMPS